MAEKKAKSKASVKKKTRISAFTIILCIIIALGIISHLLPSAEFVDGEIVGGSGVVAATVADILMAPILGFENAVNVSIFILVLGGLLAIVSKTGALETGIQVLVKKLKGRELLLIPILMFIFSVGGTTYGMLEETVGFYALLAFTMVAAGMDTVVASATVLLGAGSGVLGSTVNPFATGAAIAALPEGVEVNQGIIIFIGVILWLVSYLISVFFVMSYAQKVKDDKGSTILSLQEQKAMEKTYVEKDGKKEEPKLTGKQKVTLVLFLLTFLIMIVGFIPWADLGVEAFSNEGNWTSFLTGNAFGSWYFYDAATLFFIMAIIIGIINGLKEKEIVETFISGASDILSVVLIIAVARGASVLMQTTHLDNYIIVNAANALENFPEFIFTPLNFILHVFLSVLVPSSSGLASLSTPIMGGLSDALHYSNEVTVMTMVAANGLVNLITPTCGAIMGGLALAKVEYSTWVKWAGKIVIIIGLASMIVLTLASIVF